MRRLCCSDCDSKIKADDMNTFFSNNQYPKAISDNALNKVNNLFQGKALAQTDQTASNNRIPFTLTYYPLNHLIKKIIFENFNYLQQDATTKDIFTDLPLLDYRRDKKFKDTLLRANLSTAQNPGT